MLLGFLLILVALAGSGLFLFKPAWFPLAITSDALVYDRQFGWTLWIAGFIFIAAQVALAVMILRGRRRAEPAVIVEARWPEWLWSAATAALFVTMALAGSRGWAKMPGQSPNVETIEVYAHQFAWNFRYAGPDKRFGKTGTEFISDAGGNPFGIDPENKAGKDDVVTATLRVPAGRRVLLLLKTRDVIHDFFVRELRTKQDVVPGMEIPLELEANRPGEYEIACAELCGLGHSQMRSLLIVMPAAEYDAWKAHQGPKP